MISPGMVNFPGPNGGAPLYLNRQKRVNTILRKSACKGLPALPNRRAVAFVASVRQLALSAQAKWVRAGKKAPITSDPPSCDATTRHVRNFLGCENFYGLGAGVGRGLGEGAERGVGVGLGVELPVAVAVAVGVAVAVVVGVAVAVGLGEAVGVGDGVGPHAEGVAVAVGVGLGLGVGDGVPTAAAMSIRPQPYTLLGGPGSPHSVEEINTAELFKASRLVWI